MNMEKKSNMQNVNVYERKFHIYLERKKEEVL